MKFWTTALRYHAPATLAAFVFFYLTLSLINNGAIPIDNPLIALVFLLVIANFCAYLLSRSSKSNSSKKNASTVVSDNKVKDNEIQGSVRITAPITKGDHGVKISNNELSKNKVGGDLVLGVSKRDE